MKLKELRGILSSTTGNIQTCVVWDSYNCIDVEKGCSVEYAIKHYGNSELQRIYTYDGDIVLSVKSAQRDC